MKIRPLLAAALWASLALPAHAEQAGEQPDYPAEVNRRVGPIPIGSEFRWVTNADYPLDAWRNGEAGDVGYELAVDSAGKVTGCKVTEGSASPALKAETCRLLRERARFTPARDDKGKPIASDYSSHVIWRWVEAGMGGGSFTIKVAFTLDKLGMASNCRVIERSGTIPSEMLRQFEKNPCPGSEPRVPVRDAEGRPVARDVVLTLSVESAPAALASAEAPLPSE